MATVTSFTADRMLAIENASVIGGEVVGDNLILTRKDGSQINAGSVRGAPGLRGFTGTPGEVTNAALTSAINTVNNNIAKAGFGIVAHASTEAEQSWTNSSGSWKLIPALNLSHTLVSGRYYEISGSCVLEAWASNVDFDFEIYSNSETVARNSGHAAASNKGVGINVSRKFLATGPLSGNPGFGVRVRAFTNAQYRLRSGVSPTTFSITDLGTLT